MTKKIDHARVKSLVTELLEALGEDPSREGLKETPRRIANFWREFIAVSYTHLTLPTILLV